MFSKPDYLKNEQLDALSALRRELSNGKSHDLGDFLVRMGNPPLYAPRPPEQQHIRDGLRSPYYLISPVFASGYNKVNLLDEETKYFVIASRVVQGGLTTIYTVQFNFIYVQDNKVIAISSGGQKLSDFHKNWYLVEHLPSGKVDAKR